MSAGGTRADVGDPGAAPPADAAVVRGGRLIELVAVMDRLRSPGGCPWDAEQTHRSLVPYLVEEAFEAVEAIEADDRAGMLEELGDVLLQVVFHARMAQEHPEDPFDIDAVADGLIAKLVRRHPHVFADRSGTDQEAPDAAAVLAGWEAIKDAEKSRASVFDGVPLALPALGRAQKVLGRLDRTGAAADVLRSTRPGPDATVRDVWGRRLLDLVVQMSEAGIDPEAALRDHLRVVEEAGRSVERTGDGPAAPSRAGTDRTPGDRSAVTRADL